METTNVGSEKLTRNIRTVVGDTGELIKATAGDARERGAAQSTNTYVHENPWQSIGLAAGAGLIVGLLLGQRRQSEARMIAGN